MSILILFAGLALILLGAQFLVDGSVAVAKRFRMSEFLIGITIVGIGTSMPELATSLVGTLADKGDIAVGNVIGSNIANTFLILGATALIRPVIIERSTQRFDIPFNILISVMLLVMCFGFAFWLPGSKGYVSRGEGALLLGMFIFYMTYSFGTAKKTVQSEPEGDKPAKKIAMWLAVLMIAGGLVALIFGGRLFVRGAVSIAQALGVSESVIAISILAVGTSLPELATSVVAAIKKNTQLALGNIIGSNIANIALILGVCGTVRPLRIESVALTDFGMLILASVVLLISVFTFRKRTLDRPEGVIFLLIYFAYIYIIAFGAPQFIS